MTQTFTTSRGVTVELLSIATLLDKINGAHPMPAVPTYEVKTATGVLEKHEHTADTLETDEDRAAWAKYQADRAAAQAALNLALTRTVLLRGIKAPQPPNDDWIEEHRFLGLTVPEGKQERQLHWIETEVIASVEDVEGIMLGVMKQSGIPEEVLSSVEATFRRQVGGAAAGETGNAEEQVDGERQVRAGQNGSQKRPSSEPVRPSKRRRQGLSHPVLAHK